jgi:hypothetical protein
MGFSDFIRENKGKVAVVVGIVLVLVVLFLVGGLGSGMDINYIPV